jgi:thiamine biosynthesis protein ThiS
MNIFANGDKLKIKSGTSVEQLLDLLEEPARSDMLVSVNKIIIHPKDYPVRLLQENDRVETIYIGFGG